MVGSPPRPEELIESRAAEPSPYDRQSLSRFLRENRDRAIKEWLRAVSSIPAALMLRPKELRDHMPALIDRVLALVEPNALRLDDRPEEHAISRFQEGFNLEQVAWEYAALRSTLLRLNDREGAALPAGAIVLLNDAIDQAEVRAVGKFHRTRVRMLEALDRIAAETLGPETQPLDALMHRILEVIMDSVDAVDTSVLFLREWDELVVRAAVGLEESAVGKLRMRLGEGFAGAIAQRRRPLIAHSAESDPRVRNELLRMSGVKALYGVPLVYGDHVIGVAKMGSRRVADFSAEDRQILLSAAARAAAFIGQRREADDRGIVLHILGHDLRSPLSTVTVSATQAQRGDSSPEVARALQRIRSAGERMERIIDDLTDYTRSRGVGHIALHRESVDMLHVVTRVVSEIEARCGRKMIVEHAGDLVGEWDRGRIERVIVNLVNNAIAYGAPTGSVSIRIAGDETSVTLRVHNEGPPISADLLPLVFEPFKRGEKGSGTGLGLYIVQQIARSHGGSVGVQSSAGAGTTFTVELPRR
jgi:signal transduction histidine kinase